MIKDFISFLKKNKFDYRVLNSYEDILNGKQDDSDYDLLFKQSDFIKINEILKSFCEQYNYTIVQLYYQDINAKNYFMYDKKRCKFLNLDLYGELSRMDVMIFTEEKIFENEYVFNGISILQPYQEFIQYFIKKVDKGIISKTILDKLKILYDRETIECNNVLKGFFKKSHQEIIKVFQGENPEISKKQILKIKSDFNKSNVKVEKKYFQNIKRICSRINGPTGISIAFLGSDGSGKSTIINGLMKRTLPFRRIDYFHLKPLVQDSSKTNDIVSDPHRYKVYSNAKSYLKLCFFVFQYNFGWFKNIVPLKIKSSLIIFDRYYDDILVDNRRYRYGGSKKIAKVIRGLIPRPNIYFVLTGNPDVIYKRKQEVTFNELKCQLKGYENLVDGVRYVEINVENIPEKLVDKIIDKLMERMNDRY